MAPGNVDNAVARTRWIRAFQRSRLLVRLVRNAADAVHQALWLGLLDADRLQALTDYHYRSTRLGSTGDQNYFSEAFNLRGLFSWEQVAVDAHFAHCASVLIASAGGGRETLALTRRGVKVDAFECNPDLVESCRSFLVSQGVSAKVVEARPNEVPEALLTTGRYDGAIIGWSAYTHIVGRDRRVGFLKALHERVSSGAPLLLSFSLYRDSRACRWIFQGARMIRAARRAAPVELGDWLSTTYEHLFTEETIRQELMAAGFDLISYRQHSYGYAVGRAR